MSEEIWLLQVLFCTGGGTGIGYAQVEGMMKHGCDAVILSRRKEVIESAASQLSSSTGRRCIGLQGDVRRPESLKAAVESALKEFGRIDFVICAAGNFLSPIEQLSENAFKTVIEIDLLGTYNTLKATLPSLKKTRGSIIATSALLHYLPSPLQAHVSAAKAGIDALIRVVAAEYGPLGIRANTLHPGGIEGTEGMKRLSVDAALELKRIPIGRVGTLDDMANATIFLFSEAASNITGSALVSDGLQWAFPLKATMWDDSKL
ncbi:NAD(P)-binding protein [Atractiella rhizophila]|nr:NAD(P)-binding protein [Atractiella rhizophila]